MRRLAIIITLLFCFPTVGGTAPPKPRPDAGQGVLMISSFSQGEADEKGGLVIYREPGIARLGEFPYSRLPGLAQIVGNVAGEIPLAALARKREWVKIAYDDASREGWIRMERSWHFEPWESFLKGRTARLLPGLRNGYSVLRREADDGAPEIATLTQQSRFKIMETRGDWAQIKVSFDVSGWLRWRDADGRFLISVGDPAR